MSRPSAGSPTRRAWQPFLLCGRLHPARPVMAPSRRTAWVCRRRC